MGKTAVSFKPACSSSARNCGSVRSVAHKADTISLSIRYGTECPSPKLRGSGKGASCRSLLSSGRMETAALRDVSLMLMSLEGSVNRRTSSFPAH